MFLILQTESDENTGQNPEKWTKFKNRVKYEETRVRNHLILTYLFTPHAVPPRGETGVQLRVGTEQQQQVQGKNRGSFVKYARSNCPGKEAPFGRAEQPCTTRPQETRRQ